MHTLINRWAISLSLAVILSLTMTSADAAKCKYNVDTVNHRTGERVVWTRWNTFRLRLDPVMHVAIVEGENKYLGLRLILDRGSRTKQPTVEELDNELVFGEGAKLLIQLADESVVELHSAQEVIADTDFHMAGLGVYSVSSEAIVKFELTAENMAALTAQRLKVLRITASDSEYTYEFGKKGSDKVQKNLACAK